MKRIRRRTRNKIVGVVSTLMILVLGIFLVTVINKAGNNEFNQFVSKQAERYGIIAEESILEDYAHSDAAFITQTYKGMHTPPEESWTGGPEGGQIAVTKVEGTLNFGNNNMTVLAPEKLKEFFTTGGRESKLSAVEGKGFVATSAEQIQAMISSYIKHAQARSEAVSKKESEGVKLGLYLPNTEEEPQAPTNVVEDPGENPPSAPEQPKRIDELQSLFAKSSSEDIKKYTDASDYIAAVAKSVSGGSVDADFSALVEEYFKEWVKYQKDYDKYKNGELAEYNKKLEAWSEYQAELDKYKKAHDKWLKKNKCLADQKELMIKHNLVKYANYEETPAEVLQKVVIVDVTGCGEDVAYVNMNPFYENNFDDLLTQWGEVIPIYIYKREGQTIVFNTTGDRISPISKFHKTNKNEKFIPTFMLNYDGNQGGSKDNDSDGQVSKSIIWNFDSESEVYVKSATIHSTIIAPKSLVTIGCEQVSGYGWVVCKKYVSHSEWHTPWQPKETPTDTPPVITSTPTDEPTPTPTEEVTPTPTTTPSEEPTPTPTETPAISTTTPPVITTTAPPVSLTTPPVIYYTFSPSPSTTPLVVYEEDVPKQPAPTEEPVEISEDNVPLSNFDVPTKPKDKTTTIVEDKVPLAATVPETGDDMDPILPLAGMGIALLAMVGIVVLQRKR